MTAEGHEGDDRDRPAASGDGGDSIDGAGPDEGRPERPTTTHLLRTLRVRRNAAVGLIVGVALAALAYVVRVAELLGPFRGTQRYPVLGPEGYFLMLAFVLATSTAILVAATLTAVRAARLSREVAADGSEVDGRGAGGGDVDGGAADGGEVDGGDVAPTGGPGTDGDRGPDGG